MADLTPEQREQNRTRQMCRHSRALARQLAQEHAARAVDELLRSDPPEWFEADQAHVYREEVNRLRDRLGGMVRKG